MQRFWYFNGQSENQFLNETIKDEKKHPDNHFADTVAVML
jgi:hypothetical protein